MVGADKGSAAPTASRIVSRSDNRYRYASPLAAWLGGWGHAAEMRQQALHRRRQRVPMLETQA